MNPSPQAVLFDMDGVVTRTARLHAAAWKAVFDEFLAGTGQRPFDEQADYLGHVDGKPREEGVRAFLASRGLALPEGAAGDAPGTSTVHGLAARKDAAFDALLRARGVETFSGTLALVRALRAQGVRTAVVTSSRHGRGILASADLMPLFDTVLDGVDLQTGALHGKPEPDMYQAAARALGVAPADAVVVEDATAGVQAGRRGGFGLVIGVDRGAGAAALEAAGADLVLGDLAEIDPARLRSALAERQSKRAWQIEIESFEAGREHAVESLFTLGNGYLGVRGALDAPLPASQADMFLAGVYDRKRADLPYSEVEFLAPERGDGSDSEIVSVPFPFRLALSLDGEALTVDNGAGASLRRTLDLREAALHGQAQYEGADGLVLRVRSWRCACLHDPHLLLQELVLQVQGRAATLALDASLEPPGLSTLHPHLERLDGPAADGLELLQLRTRGSAVEICLASRLLVTGQGESPARAPLRLEPGQPLRLRRCVSVFTSRDGPDPRGLALAHARATPWEQFEAERGAHARAWQAFWNVADLQIEGRPGTEQALRFGSYHLRAAAPVDGRSSVPARALTGRAYEGHVFWDSEIFMLPLYLHTEPALARHLLLYRHGTLPGARRRAAQLGHQGACFAWESTVSGEDVTPAEIHLKTAQKRIPIFTGTQQIHVTADVAYAVWRYWDATGDDDFMASAGAELLADTARFWQSRVSWAGERAHIRGVVGPDEYHHGVNDNAYTNWMARFNLQRAAWLEDWLPAPRRAALLGPGEARAWAELAERLHCPQPNADGVIEQFEGFFALEHPVLGEGERFHPPVDRLFDWEKINRMKLIKQADVLMLPFVFPDAFSDEIVAANWRYYEPLTDHASSLSPPVHAAIAARLGLVEEARRFWRRSLWLDLSDEMDNGALGVHPACMGASWQALVFGLLGMGFGPEGPHADPRAARRLPPPWRSVALSLAWRGRRYALRIDRAVGEKEESP